jgi:hypothetical protein
MVNLQPINCGKRQYALWFLTVTTVIIIVLGMESWCGAAPSYFIADEWFKNFLNNNLKD